MSPTNVTGAARRCASWTRDEYESGEFRWLAHADGGAAAEATEPIREAFGDAAGTFSTSWYRWTWVRLRPSNSRHSPDGLQNFFGATLELMTMKARACGHDSLSGFECRDLPTRTRSIADLSGIESVGVGCGR